MGFSFKKSFNAGPFRVTVSKSGISTSFGVKGARITKKANGNTMYTLGIPGTGISHRSEKSSKKKQSKKPNETVANQNSPTSIFKTLTSDLTSDQSKAYAIILNFCNFGETEKIFNAAELNATLTEPVSNYMLNKLCEAGYLTKPIRGKYALNIEKVKQINEKFENSK